MAKILAVDGGGSGFRKAIVENGKIGQVQESSQIDSVSGLLDFVSDNLAGDIAGVSYATAGVIKNHSEIVISPNIRFLSGVNLGVLTSRMLERHVYVCNDAEAMAHGMHILFPDLEYFMGITWSSGIGVRIFKNGEILADSEGGHAQLDASPYAPLCGCGKRGCAEAILAGAGLQKRVIAETETRGIKIPEGYKWPSLFLHEQFDESKYWAVNIYNMLTLGMARFLTNIQTLLHLPAIVWKGGLGKAFLTRNALALRMKMSEMIIDPEWVKQLEFYYCWDVEPCKDANALLGAADILAKIIH